MCKQITKRDTCILEDIKIVNYQKSENKGMMAYQFKYFKIAKMINQIKADLAKEETGWKLSSSAHETA